MVKLQDSTFLFQVPIVSDTCLTLLIIVHKPYSPKTTVQSSLFLQECRRSLLLIILWKICKSKSECREPYLLNLLLAKVVNLFRKSEVIWIPFWLTWSKRDVMSRKFLIWQMVPSVSVSISTEIKKFLLSKFCRMAKDSVVWS